MTKRLLKAFLRDEAGLTTLETAMILAFCIFMCLKPNRLVAEAVRTIEHMADQFVVR